MSLDGLELSLTEWLIFAFIGANVAIVAVCLVQQGVKRLIPPAKG